MWRPLSECLMLPRTAPPRRSEVRRVRLVVVEDGAPAVDSHLSPVPCDETVVVHQLDGELPVDLARRVVRRIGALERSGRGVARAAILMACRSDSQVMAARHLLARALVAHAHAALAGATEFILAVDGGGDADLRQELMALAEVLVGGSGSHVAIRVCFGPPDECSETPVPKSGFFTRPSPEPNGPRFETDVPAVAGEAVPS